MKNHPEVPVAKWPARASRALGASVTIVGVLVLTGWLFDVESLKYAGPMPVPMNPVTALCFVLSGASLWCLQRSASSVRKRVGWSFAGVVVLIGGLKLLALFTGWDGGVDEWLFSRRIADTRTGVPNRMAPNTALNFIVAGMALLLLDVQTRRGNRPADVLCCIAAMGSILALVGYIYGVHVFYAVASFTPMALHAGLTFLMLAAGTLLARANRGSVALLMSDTAGGVVARRLFPVAIIAPIALGGIRLAGERAGLYSSGFGVALFASSQIILFVAVIWWTARLLDRSDTQRKATEQALRVARAEADRANHAKSEFLSRMSHELRTPLNAILGFGQLLESDDLPDEQQDSVAHIMSAGRHLLALINEVLDISRIEAGEMALSLEPVALPGLLRDTEMLVRPLAAERQIRIVNLPESNADIFVLADRQRLKQVLLNLLSNAIKYNRQQGEVRITVDQLPDGNVTIAIADTGIGLSPDKVARLFTAFDRLGAEQMNVEGTGLGLALSKRLVLLMDGQIKAESEPGVGSTFTVQLRGADDPAAAIDIQEEATSVTSGEHKSTILYIEDNLSNLTLVQRILARRRNFELITAMQGTLGLELAREHQPDVILLDLHLPDLGGGEVLHRLRTDQRTRGIPVIMITADATSGQTDRLKRAGADAYLTKPLNVPQFIAAIEEVLPAMRNKE